MKPINSAITGVLDRLEAQSSTGLQPGATGSGGRLTTSDETARGWLLAQASVAEADKTLLTSLASSQGVEARFQTENRFPQSGGMYQIVVGCGLKLAETHDLAGAIQRIETAMTPPEADQAENWLVALQVATAGGRKSQAGEEVALEFYSGLLRQFPADVAREACRNLALRQRPGGNWFPTAADLNAECQKLADRRSILLNTLKGLQRRRAAQ